MRTIASLAERADALPARTYPGQRARAALAAALTAEKARRSGNRALEGYALRQLRDLAPPPEGTGTGTGSSIRTGATSAGANVRLRARFTAMSSRIRSVASTVSAIAGLIVQIISIIPGVGEDVKRVLRLVHGWINTFTVGGLPPELSEGDVRAFADFCRVAGPLATPSGLRGAMEAAATIITAGQHRGVPDANTVRVMGEFGTIVGDIIQGICNDPAVQAILNPPPEVVPPATPEYLARLAWEAAFTNRVGVEVVLEDCARGTISGAICDRFRARDAETQEALYRAEVRMAELGQMQWARRVLRYRQNGTTSIENPRRTIRTAGLRLPDQDALQPRATRGGGAVAFALPAAALLWYFFG